MRCEAVCVLNGSPKYASSPARAPRWRLPTHSPERWTAKETYKNGRRLADRHPSNSLGRTTPSTSHSISRDEDLDSRSLRPPGYLNLCCPYLVESTYYPARQCNCRRYLGRLYTLFLWYSVRATPVNAVLCYQFSSTHLPLGSVTYGTSSPRPFHHTMAQ